MSRRASDRGRQPVAVPDTAPAAMPHHKYVPFAPVPLVERCWPTRTLRRAPRWCSVDLRDGNQALVEPMGAERKRALYETLLEIGLREIEVGFPAASETDFEFVREIIEQKQIPEHATIQVLTQARKDLVDRTFEALRGAERAIVHVYNSTNEAQRRLVFGMDRTAVKEIAVSGVRWVREAAERAGDLEVQLEYSPESFSATELDFSLEVCEAVLDEWEPTPQRPVILNLPATVEMSTPNVYADQVEWMSGRLTRRDCVVLSVHPHNDRGCAVAAAELAQLAGADRVEGTLFGNGERTGNVDLVTLALNLMTQGVDPELDLSDMERLVRVAEYCNRLRVPERHPYAGQLVFTAFSGSHQDAIKKGFAARAREGAEAGIWEVPYLPVDPADLGRSYEAVVRVNSQSGKGGVSYLLERDRGFDLPRWLQVEFARAVQEVADASGEEQSAEAIAGLFEREYLEVPGALAILGHRSAASQESGEAEWAVQVVEDGEAREIVGQGAGPIEAFVHALEREGYAGLRVLDYREHAVAAGADAKAIAYVQVALDGARWSGVGEHRSIVTASLRAIASAVARARRR